MLPSAYLDECVDVRLADGLRQRGFAALTAAEAGTSGTGDEEQLTFATTRGSVIISHNRRHFQRLHVAALRDHQAHGGIVILPESRQLTRLIIRAAMMLDWLGAQGDYRSRYFTWGNLQYLLTQGYRLSGYSDAEVRLALAQER
jgi:hypothetical protein